LKDFYGVKGIFMELKELKELKKLKELKTIVFFL